MSTLQRSRAGGAKHEESQRTVSDLGMCFRDLFGAESIVEIERPEAHAQALTKFPLTKFLQAARYESRRALVITRCPERCDHHIRKFPQPPGLIVLNSGR